MSHFSDNDDLRKKGIKINAVQTYMNWKTFLSVTGEEYKHKTEAIRAEGKQLFPHYLTSAEMDVLDYVFEADMIAKPNKKAATLNFGDSVIKLSLASENVDALVEQTRIYLLQYSDYDDLLKLFTDNRDNAMSRRKELFYSKHIVQFVEHGLKHTV